MSEEVLKLQDLVGRQVTGIFMGDDYLLFETVRREGGRANVTDIAFQVEGDCCSNSEFFDFYGVEALLNNGIATGVESVYLSPGDAGYRPETWEEGVTDEAGWTETQVYGYRITTEHPLFGAQSSVFSFRNISNGYYGGWMEAIHPNRVPATATVELLTDKVG